MKNGLEGYTVLKVVASRKKGGDGKWDQVW